MLRDPNDPTPPPGRSSRGERPAYPTEKARGGEIILRTRWERMVFVAGLAAAFVLALVLAIWW